MTANKMDDFDKAVTIKQTFDEMANTIEETCITIMGQEKWDSLSDEEKSQEVVKIAEGFAKFVKIIKLA